MEYLGSPVGAVNDRFTCCTYQALTKGMPDYCDVFDNLLDYCKRDYQRYGGSSYNSVPAETRSAFRLNDNAKYVDLPTPPTLVTISLVGEDEPSFDVQISTIPAAVGLYRKPRVQGDFSSVDEASGSGIDTLIRVTVQYSSREQQVLLLNAHKQVDVPLLAEGDGPTNPRSVLVAVQLLELVLPADASEIEDIAVDLVRLS
jgi:hypothetical protein